MQTRTVVLVAAITASSMSYIDGTALTVALPVIKAHLPASDTAAQWVLDGYLLLLSSLILIGGSLGDRYGRRRLFAAGTWIFGLASVACGFAPTAGVLVAARCVQGVGAALMIPESLALITAAYDPGTRGRAIGLWAAASAVTGAVGPALGGFLTQTLSWRWVFWINIPLAIVVLALCTRIPETGSAHVKGRPDLAGSGCLALGLGALVLGLMEMQHAPHPAATPLVVAGAALIALFVAIERRASDPVAPLRLFRSRAFTVANVYTFALYAALGGALFFVPFELQSVMRYSPQNTGFALLPTIIIIAVGSVLVGAFARRLGTRAPLAAGALVAAIGFALFARLGPGAPYLATVFPASVVLGIGFAIAVTPLVAAVMGAADADDVGAASGINNSISRIGNLVAIAVLGLVIAAAGAGPFPTAGRPHGFADAMLAAAAMALAASVSALLLPVRAP